MPRLDRLFVILALLAIVVWRFTRFMRLGMSKRPQTLGVPGGLLPADPQSPTTATSVTPSSPGTSSFASRSTELLITIGIILIGNAVLWFCLLELPILNRIPTLPLGVIGVFANFYLIPFARNSGRRYRHHLDKNH